MNLVARSPHAGVETPKVVRPPVRYLQPEEVAKFLAAVRGDRLEAFYVLTLATGTRSGELLGLDWNNVDLPAAQVRVLQSLHELAGKVWIGPPKTEASLRPVDLPAVAVAALK
jgi:integrase